MLKLKVTHPEMKRVLAIFSHLNQVFRTALDGGQVRKPTEMEHSELLLAAASLRALFFDVTPSPLLTTFLGDHGVKLEMEGIETNLGLALLSRRTTDGHIADYIGGCIIGSKTGDILPVDKEETLLAVHENWLGMEGLRDEPDLWIPTDKQDSKIKSSLSNSTNCGPLQFLRICRRRVPVHEWGSIRIGYLKHIRIDRKNIICHVANQLGGVHYKSPKHPSETNDPNNYEQYSTLLKSYDWDNQALMHAGLVAVALACIEVVTTPEIVSIRSEFSRSYNNRQKSLIDNIEMTSSRE